MGNEGGASHERVQEVVTGEGENREGMEANAGRAEKGEGKVALAKPAGEGCTYTSGKRLCEAGAAGSRVGGTGVPGSARVPRRTWLAAWPRE